MSEQREATSRAPVQIVRAADPAGEAQSLSRELGADVVDELPSAERQVRVRVEAARHALGGDADADAELLERRDSIRAAAAAPPAISDDDVGELERLARDLSRAARIRERTEARFTENLQAKLSATGGLTLHPGAIQAAATAVVEAERSLERAEQALTDFHRGTAAVAARPAPEPMAAAPGAVTNHPVATAHAGNHSEDPVLRRPLDDFDEVALDKRRSLLRGFAVFCVLAGLGIVALGLGQPALAIAAFAIGILLGALVAVRGRRKASSASVATPAAMAPAAPAPAAAPPPEPVAAPTPVAAEFEPDSDDRIDQQVALEGARDDAEEQVRLARTRWRQLAGPDADPHHPDEVLRAHDPQLAYDSHLAEASPTVRTVAAFHRSAQARWKVLWASIGHEQAPDPEDLGVTLDALLGDHRRAVAELRRLEAADARAEARAMAQRPLVFVEPRAWITPGRLAQLLSSVPPEGSVLLVERDEQPAQPFS